MSNRAKKHRITVQQPTYSQENEYKTRRLTGHANVTGLVNIPARWVPTAGMEARRGGEISNLQIEATIVGYFEINDPRMSIDTKWKVLYDGKLYEIVSVREIEKKAESRWSEFAIYVKAPANG